eukprot:scaffold229860_cov17-Prasinocladus_malaysianus.AAC.1
MRQRYKPARQRLLVRLSTPPHTSFAALAHLAASLAHYHISISGANLIFATMAAKRISPVWKSYIITRNGVVVTDVSATPSDDVRCVHCKNKSFKGLHERALAHVAGVAGRGAGICPGPARKQF